MLNALLIYFTSDNGFGMCCNMLFFSLNLLLGDLVIIIHHIDLEDVLETHTIDWVECWSIL